jgi:hypothetical protein
MQILQMTPHRKALEKTLQTRNIMMLHMATIGKAGEPTKKTTLIKIKTKRTINILKRGSTSTQRDRNKCSKEIPL